MATWSKRILKWPKRLLLALWCMLMLLVGGVIWFENQSHITFTMFSYEFNGIIVGPFICFVLIMGFLLGFATSWLSAQLKVMSHSRRAKRAEKEVERMRSQELPVPGNASTPKSTSA